MINEQCWVLALDVWLRQNGGAHSWILNPGSSSYDNRVNDHQQLPGVP
jgi:hypothetical protein